MIIILRASEEGPIAPGRQKRTHPSRQDFSVDLIPDPFIIIGNGGDILELNISGAALLGAERSSKTARPYSTLDRKSVV